MDTEGAYQDAYLTLLARALSRYEMSDVERLPLIGRHPLIRRPLAPVQALLRKRGLEITRVREIDHQRRRLGQDWPQDAETMIGVERLLNFRYCIETALADGISGDVIETGVWRGGASIYARAVLNAYGAENRVLWVADSFEGLPAPDAAKYPADAGDLHHTNDFLAVGVDEVRRNFDRYGLLHDNVRFLVGWFSDTLPAAPINELAVARLDGDMYASTMDALSALYPKVSPGGFVIIDDYALAGARQAVDDYRRTNRITDEIHDIDGSAVYWRRPL